MIESISNAYHSFINYIGMSMANMLGMPVQASKLGEKVDVLVKAIDNMGRINLSRKALFDDSDTEN